TSNDIAINTLDFSNIYLQESLNMYFGKPINSFEEVKKCLKTIASKDTEVISIEEEAIKFMEKNYMNNINVKDIADKLGITPNYLSSLFHNKMGIKLVDYLLQIRMERAMYLLKNNQNATIKNIAIMVGISNTRYFSNLFKAYYGVLPSQVKG
ncbi:MAG: helix-turn-helix transcriptional regulator, partial [Bacteroidales bacterium]|nr:helix-turn-helix transcriptional regulator [Bacteroidales bacterium]